MRSKRRRIPIQHSYNRYKGIAICNWVMMSGGVSSMARTRIPIKTCRRWERSCCGVTNPMRPSRIRISGSSKASPKPISKCRTNPRYFSIFQLATVLSHHANRTWFSIGAYAIAASVGVQRVMSDAHWTSDVIVSAAFGTAVARCVVLLHESYGGPRPVVTATAQGPAMGLVWRF